jgi:hypothetical protein
VHDFCGDKLDYGVAPPVVLHQQVDSQLPQRGPQTNVRPAFEDRFDVVMFDSQDEASESPPPPPGTNTTCPLAAGLSPASVAGSTIFREAVAESSLAPVQTATPHALVPCTGLDVELPVGSAFSLHATSRAATLQTSIQARPVPPPQAKPVVLPATSPAAPLQTASSTKVLLLSLPRSMSEVPPLAKDGGAETAPARTQRDEVSFFDLLKDLDD